MASRFLSSKYQQYKRDTLQLSSWLAQAALNYGFPVEAFTPSPTALQDEGERRTAAQLKNAKKKAKQRAKTKDNTVKVESNGDGHDEDAPPETTVGENDILGGELTFQVSGDYILKIPEFGKIAKFLVENQVVIPNEVRKLLRRCIGMRYNCLKKFLERPDAFTAGHEHFIKVLENVEMTFNSVDAVPESRKSAKAGKNGVASVSNRFDSLALEEGEEEEDVADITLPEAPRPPRPVVVTSKLVVAPEASRAEGIIAVLAFFADVHSIRSYLDGTWREYKDGQIDIISAAVVTNTALELLRRSHDDIVKHTLPLFSNNLGLILVYLLCLVNGGAAQMPAYNQIDETDQSLTAAYDYLLLPIFQLLGGLGDVIKDEFLPTYKPGYFGQWDPSFGSKNLSFKKRWLQAQCLICESFAEYLMVVFAGRHVLGKPAFQAYQGTQDNLFFLDEMAVQMAAFATSKKPTLLLMVHAQVFVDINRIMGEDNKRGRKDMRDGISVMLKTLAKRPTVESKIKPTTWPSEAERGMEEFSKELETWKTLDPVELCLKNVKQGEKPAATKSSFMDRNPMLCGLILFRLKLQYQKMGFALANAWGTVLSTAHLLVACRHYDRVDQVPPLKPWPDMDLVMELHGKEDLFGGKMPENIDDSLYSFLYMMGYSKEVASAFRDINSAGQIPEYIRNRRRAISLESEDGPKGLRDHAQIVPIFYRKYCGDYKLGTRLDIGLIEKLLLDVQSDIDKSRSSRKRKLRRERRHRTQKFSLVQILSVIEAGLTLETASVHFDYIGMHLRCIQLLKKVQQGAHNYLVQKHGEGYMENDSQLPFIVGWILKIAALSGKASEALGIMRTGRDGVTVVSKLLLGAVGSMNEFLKEPGVGRVEVDKLSRS